MALSEQAAAARYEEATTTYGAALERLARHMSPTEALMIRSTTAGMTMAFGLAGAIVIGMTQPHAAAMAPTAQRKPPEATAPAPAAPPPATPAAPTPAAADAMPPAIPSDQYIRDVLIKRIDTEKQSIGIVVGAIDSKGRRIVAHGSFSASDTRPVDGDTVFEIGSITKVFTALLLADMVKRNEVALTDPIAKYVPPDAKVPERNGRAITLEDLATHTSGLPRMPSNFAPKDPLNPYADYGIDRLTQFLSSYTLTRDPGAQYEYSNLGGGLLGTVLARRAGMNYEALVESRITGPLGMKNTRLMLSPDMKARMATGHNGQLAATPNWDFPADTSSVAGAGGLRSTVNDMLIFLAANMEAMKNTDTAKPSPGASAGATAGTSAGAGVGAGAALQPAMKSLLANRRPTGNPGLDIALGWHVAKTPSGREIVWHNGGTGGFRSYMGFDPANGLGVVVLSNTSTPRGVDDIGLHLLVNKAPLWKPPTPRKETTVDAALFDGYTGRYEIAPNFILTITREGSQLFGQATNQGRFELYAESDRKYFAKVADILITFEVDERGKATSLVLQQAGVPTVNAKRIE